MTSYRFSSNITRLLRVVKGKVYRYTGTMGRKKRSFLLLLLSLLSLAGLCYLIVFLSPNAHFSTMNYELSTIYIFFLLLFLFFSSLFGIVFNNTRRGITWGIFITLYCILRFLGLKSILFFVLVAALLFTIEHLLSQKQ